MTGTSRASSAAPYLTARAVWAAELNAGRRAAHTLDALARAVMCEAHADEYYRGARHSRGLADHATTNSDAVRFTRCAEVAERSAAVWRERAAVLLATETA